MEATIKKELYIPVNIRTRFQFFDGYGMAELFYTAIMALISGFVAFGVYAINKNTTLCVLIVLITIAASVMALAKDQSNQSIIDQVRYLLRFMNAQRKYPYKYKPDWGA